MENEIAIVPASLEHREGVYRLLCELEGPGFDRAGFDLAFDTNVKDPCIFYFVAFLQGLPIGFISLHIQMLLHHGKLIGEIQELIVTEACRSKHIGEELFHKALQTARDKGCAQLEVSSRNTRVRSHRFYERMGMNNTHYTFCLPIDPSV